LNNKTFFIDVLDSIEKLVISQDADPETAMETIENDWAEKLLRRCLKTSNNVTNKNTTKTALTLFYGSLKELQELSCKLLPGYIVEYLMPNYIRNTEPAQVASTAKGVDYKALQQFEQTQATREER